jgi:hypothetical protein
MTQGDDKKVLGDIQTSPSPSSTGFTVSIRGLLSEHVGPLRAIVSVHGRKSPSVIVANIVNPPFITTSDTQIAQSGSGNRLEITGGRFGNDVSSVHVALSPAVTATVIACKDNLIIVDTGSTSGIAVGTDIKAQVTTGLVPSDAPAMVKIARITASVSAPDVTASSSAVSFSTTMISIAGSNFGTVASRVRVYLAVYQGKAPSGTVTSVSNTALTMAVNGMSALNTGTLRAVVTVLGVKTAERSIGSVQEIQPVVTTVQPLEGPMEGNTMVTIDGANFQFFPKGKLSCLWGGNAGEFGQATLAFANGTKAVCATPRHHVGAAALSIRLESSSTLLPTNYEFQFNPSTFISDSLNHRVLRFNAVTGAFVDEFIAPRSGGLAKPYGTAFGPDKHFYVSSGGTSTVNQYDGRTGEFIRIFCRVSGGARGLVFHYADLYVVSPLDHAVYRYNGATGALRGTYSHGMLHDDYSLKLPWGIQFESGTNRTYVSSQQTHNLVRYKAPSHGLDLKSHTSLGKLVYSSEFDGIWTRHPLQLITGFDFAPDSVYAVSPSIRGVVQYNRTTGERLAFIEDEKLSKPMDVAVVGSHIYVCSLDTVRVYHRATTEFVRAHTLHAGMQCANMLRHIGWATNKGFV